MSRQGTTGIEYENFKTLGHETRAGDFELIIFDADYDTGGATEGYIEVQDVKEIKYEFDVPDDEDNPTAIRMNAGSIDVTLFDDVEMADGTYRKLHQQLLGADPVQYPFDVQITITKDSTPYVFSMQFGYDDIDFDYRTRKIELQLHSADLLEGPISSTVQNFVLNKQDYVSGGGYTSVERFRFREANGVEAVPIYTMLEDALDALNPNVATEISTNVFSFQTFSELTNAVNYFVTADLNVSGSWDFGPDFDQDETTILDQLAYLAAAEGAFYGQGFDKSFYIHRNTKDPSYEVSIPYDKVEEVEIVERRNKSLLYVESNTIGKNVYGDPSVTFPNFNNDYKLFSSSVEYFESVKNDKFFASSHPLGFVSPLGLHYSNFYTEYTVTYQDPEGAFTNIHTERQAEYDALASAGLDAYKRAVGASKPLRIKIKGWDIFTLRPYQWFNITGTGTPSFLAGKDFRVSEIAYDLKTDKYEVEAYQF